MSTPHHLPYDVSRLSERCAKVLLGVAILEGLYGLSAVYSYVEIQAELAGDAPPLVSFLDQQWYTSDLVMLSVSLPYLLLYLMALGMNGVWLYRSSANAAAVVPSEARTRPGWAVGWYFVPIANLFKPYGSMRETWNSFFREDENLHASLPSHLHYWWGAWILSNILSQISQRFADGTLEDYATSSLIDMANTPVSIAAALLFRRILLDVTAAQKMPRRRMEEVFA